MGEDSQTSKMIVKIFAFCLLGAVVASSSSSSSESSSSSSESGSGEDFRGPGLYFSPIEVDLACTAGSPLGAKLASAFETCLGGEEVLKPEQVGETERRRRRRPNRKPKKCPTVDQIKEKMGEGMEGDWCVLYQLGWIDENGKENNETSTADLMSLKPEVLAGLDESAMATCAQERVAMIGKMMEKKHKRGANKFSEEDKAELTEMALKIQGDVPLCLPEERQEPSLRFLPGTSNGGCFHRGFNNRCPSHDDYLVLSNLMQKK